MAYAPPALRRRSRRRRNLVIVVILAAIIAAVALAVRYRTDERIAMDYLTRAREVAEAEMSLAGDLEEVLRGIGTMERPEIVERLLAFSEDSAQLRSDLAEADLTGSIAEVHGFLTVSVTAWDDALGSLEAAVVEILDSEDATTGASLLDTAFSSLRVGDRAYFGFQRAVAELDPELVTEDFPTVSYTGGERTDLYDSEVLAERLRAIRRLGGDHDVALTGILDPEPLLQEGSLPIVPASETFLVQLVVSNTGNVDEASILITLQLTPRDAAQDPITLQNIVPFLEPDEATTISFDLTSEVIPGSLYELQAMASIAEDADLDNNEWELVFLRNAP
jgi:hypothetical protein